jgi:LPXTG-motif cell wall-anchored protein
MPQTRGMNRAQRRNQTHSKSNLRKAGITYLTAAGVVSGTFGLASPAHALTLTPTNCSELEMDLNALEVAGGTLTADFAGTCDFAEGFIFSLPSTIIGPVDGSLTLRFTGDRVSTPVPVDYNADGLTGQADLTISNLNFTRPPNSGGFDYFVFGWATTTISNLTFSDAELSAAVYAEGNLIVSDSTFENLTSFSGGSAITSTFATTISNSTFADNTADGQASGGAILASGSLEVTSSTFDSNQAGDQGGAITSYAGARISNSTFVGNSAMSSAAVHLGEGGVISNSTFWNNGDADTFSIFAGGASPSYLFANILANDTPNTVKLIDPTQTTIDLGANLYTDSTFDNTTSGEEGSSELVTVAELNLSGLASTNATSTPTVAIGADSVAYDYYTADSPGINPTSNGDFVDSLLASEDQRGADRPLSFGYDVGAYESGEKPEPSPSETPETNEVADSESLADTGLETTTNLLGLVGLGLAAMLGGSVGLVKRRRKV